MRHPPRRPPQRRKSRSGPQGVARYQQPKPQQLWIGGRSRSRTDPGSERDSAVQAVPPAAENQERMHRSPAQSTMEVPRRAPPQAIAREIQESPTTARNPPATFPRCCAVARSPAQGLAEIPSTNCADSRAVLTFSNARIAPGHGEIPVATPSPPAGMAEPFLRGLTHCGFHLPGSPRSRARRQAPGRIAEISPPLKLMAGGVRRRARHATE